MLRLVVNNTLASQMLSQVRPRVVFVRNGVTFTIPLHDRPHAESMCKRLKDIHKLDAHII